MVRVWAGPRANRSVSAHGALTQRGLCVTAGPSWRLVGPNDLVADDEPRKGDLRGPVHGARDETRLDAVKNVWARASARAVEDDVLR